jgi:regulator of protease activity HflC (stomatin/prohibitin superfamily)
VDKAFGWLGDIFQNLLKIIPALVIVPVTHGGIAFVHGHRVKEWKPGLHIYWPVVTSYKTIAVVRQTQMIKSKTVMTKDLKTVIVGALVTYWINDVVSALAKIADLPSDIMERSMEAILTEVSHHDLADIQADRQAFNKRLVERVTGNFEGYGIEILSAQLTEFAPCRAIAINGHAAIGNYQLWTGF